MKTVIYWEYFQRYHNARIAALLRHVETSEHEVIPVSLSEVGYHGHKAERDAYVDLHARYLKGDGSIRPIDDPLVIAQFIELLDAEQPDAVAIVGWYGKGTREIVRWANAHSKAVVLMLAGSQHDKKRNLIKEAYKRFCFMPKIGAVLCGGLPHVRYAMTLGMKETRIFTGYNSVDNSFWAAKAEEAKGCDRQLTAAMGLTPQRYFISVGRFIGKKNFVALIEQYAAYRSLAGKDAWDLVIAGDGELREVLEAKIGELNLSDCVKLPGYLSSEALAPYLGLAGAFILPSSGYEQWGLVVNEAMAAGLPVIVSDICGCCEDLVIEGKTGYSFSPSSMDSLSCLMQTLSEDPLARDRMANAAGEHIHNYSPEVFAKNFLAACQSAVDRVIS
jgi:glycosyltransferase involved in cell wall biosynthesis